MRWLLVAVSLMAIAGCKDSDANEQRAETGRKLDRLQKQVDGVNDQLAALTKKLDALEQRWSKLLEPAVTRKSLDITMPRAAKPDQVTTSLVVSVTKGGDIYVGGKLVADRDLDRAFRAAVAQDRDVQLLIRADKTVRHARIVAIMDRAKQAGLSRIAIASTP